MPGRLQRQIMEIAESADPSAKGERLVPAMLFMASGGPEIADTVSTG